MIKHNELAARLNSRLYKDTTVNEEEDKLSVIEEILPIPNSPDHANINAACTNLKTNRVIIIDTIEFAINVLSFGYAAQFLLNGNWPVLGTIAVGYTINFIFNKILFLFSS